MHQVPAPALAQARHLGQFVDQAGGDEHMTGAYPPAVGERHLEAVAVAAYRLDPALGQVPAVAADLVPAACQQFGRRYAVVAQQRVHAVGGRVARFAAVHHEHRPACPGQHQRAAQPGRAAADHQYLVVLT